MSSSARLLILLAGGFVGLSVITILGFGVIRYQRFQATANTLSAQALINQVSITNLSNGAEAQIGAPLIIEAWDWEDDSGDDLICVGQTHIDARSLFDWAEVDESGVIFGPPQSTGSCTISFTVQAVP